MAADRGQHGAVGVLLWGCCGDAACCRCFHRGAAATADTADCCFWSRWRQVAVAVLVIACTHLAFCAVWVQTTPTCWRSGTWCSSRWVTVGECWLVVTASCRTAALGSRWSSALMAHSTSGTTTHALPYARPYPLLRCNREAGGRLEDLPRHPAMLPP